MQRFPSSQGVPEGASVPWQLPPPLQESLSVQGLESEQAVPAGAVWTGTQVPDPLQASFWVQGFPSLQGAPADAGRWTHP